MRTVRKATPCNFFVRLVQSGTSKNCIPVVPARYHISAVITYRLDPKNPRRLTPEEARRLDETPIDYSDIPPLDEQFFTRARAMTDAPETIWIEPNCKECDHLPPRRGWHRHELEARCASCSMGRECPMPVQYIRADIAIALEEKSVDIYEEQALHIAILTDRLKRARDRLDAFADADLMDQINSALAKEHL